MSFLNNNFFIFNLFYIILTIVIVVGLIKPFANQISRLLNKVSLNLISWDRRAKQLIKFTSFKKENSLFNGLNISQKRSLHNSKLVSKNNGFKFLIKVPSRTILSAIIKVARRLHNSVLSVSRTTVNIPYRTAVSSSSQEGFNAPFKKSGRHDTYHEQTEALWNAQPVSEESRSYDPVVSPSIAISVKGSGHDLTMGDIQHYVENNLGHLGVKGHILNEEIKKGNIVKLVMGKDTFLLPLRYKQELDSFEVVKHLLKKYQNYASGVEGSKQLTLLETLELADATANLPSFILNKEVVNCCSAIVFDSMKNCPPDELKAVKDLLVSKGCLPEDLELLNFPGEVNSGNNQFNKLSRTCFAVVDVDNPGLYEANHNGEGYDSLHFGVDGVLEYFEFTSKRSGSFNFGIFGDRARVYMNRLAYYNEWQIANFSQLVGDYKIYNTDIATSVIYDIVAGEIRGKCISLGQILPGVLGTDKKKVVSEVTKDRVISRLHADPQRTAAINRAFSRNGFLPNRVNNRGFQYYKDVHSKVDNVVFVSQLGVDSRGLNINETLSGNISTIKDTPISDL